MFELIPHGIFHEDFPTLFATEYAHWMDVQSGEVEFRPLDKLWDHSPHNWRLHFSPLPNGSCNRMTHGTTGTCHLVDIRSRTFEGIAARIGPLEASEYLTIVYDTQTCNISIELPRFCLSFFLNDDKLESKNFQCMVIDDNQSTGTMIGLRSQLVLRHKDPTSASLPRSRYVLIPHGDVKFSHSQDRNHVRVEIDTRTRFMRQVAWYKYEVDSDLGLLVGSVSLSSRLFMIYLHALCSHPLPDLLTSQTGTIHALQQLGGASCYSFQMLMEADIKLLRHIGSITPPRFYYPKHLSCMQSIKWSPHLLALSQHGGFDNAVCSILEYARSLTIFIEAKDEGVDFEYKPIGDTFLTDRAERRNTIYYEGKGDVPAGLDRPYDSRDSPHIEAYYSDGIEALNTSRLVYAWPPGLTRRLGRSELLETFQAWGSVGGPIPNFSLVYNQDWLYFDLPSKWLSIYDQCRRTGQHPSRKFELIFSFAALAYSAPSARKSIPILLAFATIPTSFSAPPLHSSYNLTDGFEPERGRVCLIINSGLKDIDNSPAGQLHQWLSETSKEFSSRKETEYRNISQNKIQIAADYLMARSSTSNPQSPFWQADDSRWFNTANIMDCVTKYFSSCSSNADLCNFVFQLTTKLHMNYVGSPFAGVEVPIFQFAIKAEVSDTEVEINNSIGRDRLPLALTLKDLLSNCKDSAPARSPREFASSAPAHPRQLGQPIDTNELHNLIAQFKHTSHSALTELYSDRLEKSRVELHGLKTTILPEYLPSMDVCLEYRDHCRSRLNNISSSIRSALAPSTSAERMLKNAGLWPPVHARSLLHPLASTANIQLPPEWVESLTVFSQAYIEYQHSQRLLTYALRAEVDNFYKELDNASFNELDAKNLDWLLIQVKDKSSMMSRT